MDFRIHTANRRRIVGKKKPLRTGSKESLLLYLDTSPSRQGHRLRKEVRQVTAIKDPEGNVAFPQLWARNQHLS